MSALTQLILSAAGFVITILLGVIAYFLKKWIDSTDTLNNTMHELKTEVALLQSAQGNQDKSCSLKHEVIDKRLNAHSQKLNEHSEAIAELKAVKSSGRKLNHSDC